MRGAPKIIARGVCSQSAENLQTHRAFPYVARTGHAFLDFAGAGKARSTEIQVMDGRPCMHNWDPRRN